MERTTHSKPEARHSDGTKPFLPASPDKQRRLQAPAQGERLFVSRRRTQHFQGSEGGCGSGLDPELIENVEDMFFHRGFAVGENHGNLAIGLTLSEPEQRFGDAW